MAKDVLKSVKQAVKFEVEMNRSKISSKASYKQQGLLEKYLVIKEFFGLSAINIENISRTYRERQMKIQQIRENFNILSQYDTNRLK